MHTHDQVTTDMFLSSQVRAYEIWKLKIRLFRQMYTTESEIIEGIF